MSKGKIENDADAMNAQKVKIEIGRILHLKFEISNFEFEVQDSSNFNFLLFVRS